VTVTSAETDVHLGTLLRNHLYTVDNPYTNETIYTDVAKVTFDARPISLDAVNFTRRFHEGKGVKTFHEIADDMAHVAFDAHQNSHKAVSLFDSGASKCIGYLVGYSKFQSNAYRMWLPHWDVTLTSRDIIFNENIPRGDIDFSTDEYWLEIRKARRDETK
jgi:hypothetical protein